MRGCVNEGKACHCRTKATRKGNKTTTWTNYFGHDSSLLHLTSKTKILRWKRTKHQELTVSLGWARRSQWCGLFWLGFFKYLPLTGLWHSKRLRKCRVWLRLEHQAGCLESFSILEPCLPLTTRPTRVPAWASWRRLNGYLLEQGLLDRAAESVPTLMTPGSTPTCHFTCTRLMLRHQYQ